MSGNYIVETIKERFRQHSVILSILHLLERVGIQITPYYIHGEHLSNDLESSIEPRLKPVASGILSDSEIRRLYAHPEIQSLDAERGSWQDENCVCFALKHNEEIVAYLWCNLHYFNSSFLKFPLLKNEAYLFRARTMHAYRGMNLAPFLRYQIYKHLIETGHTKFYSITEYFNAPAANLKKKLKARPLKLFLYLGFLNKFKWNIILKEFPE